ncbi:MAG: pilus assembly protein PilM [Planctomycetales bacterium]|nr:pilus assembly protein PilM [Planctomycetales bacterium]
MFEYLLKQKTQPIGLDVGHSMIKMIQLSPGDNAICVEAAEEEALDRTLVPDSDDWRRYVVERIIAMYRRGGFRGRQVVSCLPGDEIKVKSLRLDTANPAEIEEMVHTEVARRFGLNPDKDEIRYIMAGNAYQGEEVKNEVIFFGIENNRVVRHIALLEEAKLVPLSLDTVPCALFRCFQATLRRREDKDLVSVFVDLGAQYTTVIIGKGQEIAFVKQIPIAGNALNEQVASRLGISLEEAAALRARLCGAEASQVDSETRRAVIDAMTGSIETLAHEISLCFRYYAVTFRGRRPAEAVFAGGEAYESALIDVLRRHLGVDIRIAEPLRGYDVSRAKFDRRRKPQMCEWAVAVGLALKGMELNQIQNPSLAEIEVPV